MTIPSALEGGSRQKVLVQLNELGLRGTEISAVQFAAELRAHGYDSVLFGPADTLPAEGPSLHDVAAEYQVELHAVERPATTRRAAALWSSLADRVGADLVHVYSQTALRGAYLGPCRFARRPLVITTYEMSVPDVFLTAPPLIVGTRQLADDLAHRSGRTHLVSPPVDIDRDSPAGADGASFRARLGIRATDLLVVWVGRLSSTMKSPAVECLIDAMPLLRHPDVVVAIVGGGDAEAHLMQRGDRVNAQLGRWAVRFAGSMADPRAAYAAADVSVGMGSSAARALAFGSPLVVVGEAGWSRRFDEAGAADLFRDSFWSAAQVAEGAERLARELEPLLAGSALRESSGRFGRRFAEESFGLTAMAARVAAIYRDARADYRLRHWLRDADLEVRAAWSRWEGVGPRRADAVPRGEYRFSPSSLRRRRAARDGEARRSAPGSSSGGALV
ncbi:glycosyltransferase family 4 protein [Microbacterium caowuchunii]|uniref:glycosyltransferase family 4 protein n=1 Tax=Microbacterium caowuchunii TaxID=2614638 RepID=UPI00124652D7|nr:glycosyltransferase family 4 protein [Microbacterium caowuchunii]QEW00812.1 glycosyltransferase family 4 protein [Microbacterium caowuchunii]